MQGLSILGFLALFGTIGQAQICGQAGWGSTTYYSRVNGMALAECKASCLADPQCRAYSDDYRGETGNCYLYKTAVKDTPTVAYQNWAMYDRECTTNPICGNPGWGSTTYYKRINGMALAECKSTCLADSDCRAYSDDYRGQTGNCYLYKTAVKDTPTVDYQNWAMYDRSCGIVPSPVCGKSGWGAKSYYKKNTGMALAECRDACLADYQCVSYSDDSRGGSGNCYLYTTTVNDTEIQSDTNWAMYDRACGVTAKAECGTPGWGSTTYYKRINGLPLAQCKALCLSESDCRAYSDDQRGQTGNCYLYTTAVKDTPIVDYPNWAMYDRTCDAGAVPDCGKPGWGSTTYYKRFWNMALDKCKETCLSDPQCLSYSDDKNGQSGNCYLYKAAVKDTPVINDTNWAMYDRYCGTKSECGKSGWGSSTYYKKISGMPLAQCRVTCLADSSCQSYSDDKRGESGNCYLYSTAVRDTPTIDDTYWALYDRDCNISPTCGTPGWGSTTYYSRTNGKALADCKASCLADSKCAAYSDDYRGQTGNCYLYTTRVKDTPIVDYPNWAMYDRECSSTIACGQPGWGSTTYYKRIDGMPLAKCKATCLADSDCKAYSDDQRGETGNCYLYKTAVKDTPTTSYPNWAMYDRGCTSTTCVDPETSAIEPSQVDQQVVLELEDELR